MKNRYIELNEDKSPKTDFDIFYDDFTSLDNAGLILDKNIVVVDFDVNPEIAETILKTCKTKAVKTKRGWHLYFKIPKDLKIANNTHVTTVLGNVVDYKTGFNNKNAYAIVKLNGVVRDVYNENIELPFLPKILYPTNTKTDIINLKEGSRNSELFNHLKHVYHILDDKKLLLDLGIMINRFLNTPLEENEILNIVNSILNYNDVNEDVYTTDAKGNRKIDIFKLSNYLIKKLNCTIFLENLYFKLGQGYSSNYRELLTLVKDMGYNLTKQQDSELLHQLKKTENVFQDNNNNFIILNNGYIINKGVIEYYNGLFSPYRLNVDYNPNAYDQNVDDFINWFVCDNKELRTLIEEILGHILMTDEFPQLSFFFVSDRGKNGKSTFFEMITNFCGELAESLALEELTTAEKIVNLKGKLVNCGDDIDNNHILTSRIFKNLVAGNKIMARELYSQSTKFKNKATLLFSCNEMPNFKDKSGGINRRIRIIPCDNFVEKPDLSIDTKLSTPNAKSYILNLALKGIKSILEKNGEMINPEVSQNITKEYIKDNDGVILFLEENEIPNESIFNNIYMLYEVFAQSSNLGVYSKIKFGKRLRSLGYDIVSKKIQSKTYKVIVKKVNY